MTEAQGLDGGIMMREDASSGPVRCLSMRSF